MSPDLLEDRVDPIFLVWNRDNAREVEKIKKKFLYYLKKGWIAFAVTSNNRKIHVLKFDPKFEKICLMRIVEGG